MTATVGRAQGVLDLGWDEQTKYRVDPSFYNVDVNLLVNLDIWNGLTDEQRAKLEEGAAWMEELNAKNAEINAAEYAKQAEAGIETITLNDADADKWLETAQTRRLGRSRCGGRRAFKRASGLPDQITADARTAF